MGREAVIRAYNTLLSGDRKRLVFSKGYSIFEEMYELFKNELEESNFIRKEVPHLGWCEVIIEKNDNKTTLFSRESSKSN